MSEFRVTPIEPAPRGTQCISIPADKSISHRAAILAALAEGETRIGNFLPSATTLATLDCLRALGADIEQPAPTSLVVRGRGLQSLHESRDPLYCAGSGTTARLLAGLCAGQDFLSILDGTPTLKTRPMARIAEPLRAMGATVLGREDGRLMPLAVRGGHLHGMEHDLPVASAQVKSAILLAGLFADSPTVIREPGPSRDHTERMLNGCGVQVAAEGNTCTVVPPGVHFQIPDSGLNVPGDFSSAAFFIVAALVVPGLRVRLEGAGVNPTRTGLLDVLAQMGARVQIENARDESGEPVADLVVELTEELRGGNVLGALVPRMIDEFPILAIAATQARGETVVRDAHELRVKESDRIGTLARELRKLGAQIEEQPDGFMISGPTRLRGARVNAHNDHRLAMSLAVAGLVTEGETIIEGWECIADSFPEFAERLGQLV